MIKNTNLAILLIVIATVGYSAVTQINPKNFQQKV